MTEVTEQELKKFKEEFYKPNPNRDPNAAFVVTGFRGHPNGTALKRADEAEKKQKDKKDN